MIVYMAEGTPSFLVLITHAKSLTRNREMIVGALGESLQVGEGGREATTGDMEP